MAMPRTSLIFHSTIIVIIAFIWTVSGFKEYSSEIDCYFCVGDARNSTCANNDTNFDLHPDVRVASCKRGMCVKWARWKNGSYLLERTCTYAMNNFNLIISDDCRTEKFGNGYLCMCGTDKCNSAVNIHTGFHWWITFLTTFTLLRTLGLT